VSKGQRDPDFAEYASMLTLPNGIPPQVLRQKRMYEGQRETLYNQQFNMEQTRFTVESIQDTVQTVQALKAANVQMKGAMKANKELDLSFIDNLQVGGLTMAAGCFFLFMFVHTAAPQLYSLLDNLAGGQAAGLP
jgi:hypothetical protein